MTDSDVALVQVQQPRGVPMFDSRVGIRKAEGGYIVGVYSDRSAVAMREEVHVSKADAIAAATRLHEVGLAETERFLREMEERRAADRAAGYGQLGGEAQMQNLYAREMPNRAR